MNADGTACHAYAGRENVHENVKNGLIVPASVSALIANDHGHHDCEKDAPRPP